MAGVSRDLVDRLYTAPPEEFVAARTAAVAAARAAGDAQAARELAALRKPTLAAWLVNLLAIRRPELIADLVDLSAALRAAQRELRGTQLRELLRAAARAVSGLVAAARALATEADPGLAPGKLPLAEVESTLNAALSDVDIAEQVRSGRLVRRPRTRASARCPGPSCAWSPAGWRRPGRSAVRGRRPERPPSGTPARRPGSPPAVAAAGRQRPTAPRREVRRRALARELAQARIRQEQAESELAAAVTAEHDGAGALAEVEAGPGRPGTATGRRRAGAGPAQAGPQGGRAGGQRRPAAGRRGTGRRRDVRRRRGAPETGDGEQTRPREPEPPPGGPGRRRR